MNDDKILIDALRRLSVRTGSIACLGCEYEYDCGIHGCAIICAARERLEELTAAKLRAAMQKRGALLQEG